MCVSGVICMYVRVRCDMCVWSMLRQGCTSIIGTVDHINHSDNILDEVFEISIVFLKLIENFPGEKQLFS